MIKPENVSESLAKNLFNCVSGVTTDAARYNLAAILNAAIEAGLVSPPCYVWRYDGKLIVMPGGKDVALYHGRPDGPGTPDNHGEHWKGQTE